MAEKNEIDNQSFHNPFLQEVAFEIKFPSTARIIKNFYDFQEMINEKYPNYGEDLPFFGTSEGLQPPETLRRISFRSKDDRKIIKISMNSVIFITKNYIRYEEFRSDINDIIDKFIEAFNIKKSLRIGLRYINKYNKLGGDLQKALSIVSNLFIPLFNVEKFSYEEIIGHEIVIRVNIIGNFYNTYRTNFYFNKEIQEYIHILDFDTYIEEELPIKQYLEQLDKLHEIEKKEFLTAITQEFQKLMTPLD